MANFTYFIPSNFQGMDQAILRNPNAQWYNGGNPNAGNNSGIGINIGGGFLPEITGENSIGYNWTLKQQSLAAFVSPPAQAPRTPQGACPIACSANVLRTGNVATTWDTAQPLYTPAGAASSGGLNKFFQQFAAIVTGSNPDNTEDGLPDYNSSPVSTGSAHLNTLEEGWTTSA